jgi:RNA polymerase sigma-70 factor (ECF subfamily)
MNFLTDTYVGMFHNEIKNFVYKQTRDRSLAEDIVHDVFLKARKNIDQLKDDKKAIAWLYQIARNTVIDYYRRKPRNFQLTGQDPGFEESNYVEPNYNECAANCLKNLIPSLPEKYRVPFQLADVDNLSQIALTQKLGLSYSGVKSRVQRARKMLREKLNETLIIETDSYGNVIICKDR